MKKILVLLAIILIAYFGYKVYLRNAPEKEEETPFVLDENYVLSITFSDDVVTKLIEKTYYIYNNEKAILMTKSFDRNTKKELDVTYKDVEIKDESFNVADVIKKLSSTDSGDISEIYRYKYSVKKTGATYMLSKMNQINHKILVMFGEEIDIKD